MHLLGCAVLLSALVVGISASRGCLDASGNSVDWFAALKVNDGYQYYYTTGSSWTAGGVLNTSSPSGPLGRTLLSLYSTSSSAGYILYDDEYNGDHDSNAHAKGVLSFDSSGGFWLVHSVPNFPPQISQGYQYPAPEAIYGQSFLCITMDADNISTVASLLQTDRVYVCDKSLPSSLTHIYPEVADLMNGNYVHGSASNVTEIYSKGRRQFTAFAKSGDWNNDVYEFLVQPYFRASMQWETWADGSPGPLPSFCPPTYKYESVNVQSVSLEGHTWDVNQDHSKWGCSLKGGPPVVCIGDINRQSSQYKRGGGTVCQDNADLYALFTDIIATAESC